MLGLGFGEILILLVVGIVVVGPRRLPSLMRTAGRWVAKLRRMSTDLRSQSGIDELIRYEGLEKEIADLRALTRVNVMNTLVTPMLAGRPATPAPAPAIAPTNGESRPRPSTIFAAVEPPREREYPVIGCDAYDALADDVTPYTEPAASLEMAAKFDAAASEAAASAAPELTAPEGAPAGSTPPELTAPEAAAPELVAPSVTQSEQSEALS